MESFQISFRQDSSSYRPNNSFGLTGSGTLEVGRLVRISAKKRRPFRFATGTFLDLDPVQIANVQCGGKSIRFEVLAGGDIHKPGFLQIELQDEASAQRLTQLLPATRTAAFEQQQHELDDFRQRLAQTTPRTFVTPTLVIVNVLIFAAMTASGVSMFQPDGRMVVAWGSNFGPYTTGGQWWRLFTSMFLHFGIIHLALNMWALYYNGRIVERLYGNAHFALLYVVAGLSGSIASLLWNPMVNSAGASGAIFGVFGAQLAFMLDRRNQVPASIMKEQSSSVVIFIVYSLFYGMSQKGIDNAAHLGGLAGGLLMGWLLARPLDANIRAAAGARRLLFALLAAALALPLFTLPIKDVSQGYRQEERYLADINWMMTEEKRIQDAFTRWQEAMQAEQQPAAELARQLEEEVAIPWQAMYERVRANPLSEDARLYPHQRLVLEGLRNRQEAYFLFAEALRTDSAEKSQQAKERMEAANAAIEKLKQLRPSR